MNNDIEVIGGVDTHADSHCAAVIDTNGKLLSTAFFPTTSSGYKKLLEWMISFGDLLKVGVEGTGSYGAALTRHFVKAGIEVIDVPRPDRKVRAARGKSDPIDAETAARSILAGTAGVIPKIADGQIESIRALRVVKNGAIKARTAAINALRSLIVTAPETLRQQLPSSCGYDKVVAACVKFRPDYERLDDPTQATKMALRSVALRIQMLSEEIELVDRELAALVSQAAPATLDVYGLGVETASTLLVTVGDNSDRLHSEAAFAHLCGVAPIPASSGKTQRHRLRRGGDRSANRALHQAVIVRLRHCQKTKAYVERRTAEGLSKKEIIRCLKRYLAREVFRSLKADYAILIAT